MVVDAVDAVVGTELLDVGGTVHADDAVAEQLDIEIGCDTIRSDGAPTSEQLQTEFLWCGPFQFKHPAILGVDHALGCLYNEMVEPDFNRFFEGLGQMNGGGYLTGQHLHQ